jgi:hypothetical protein
MTEAQHIRPDWQKLAARLQHEARLAVNREANGVISIKILVDTCGNPVQWIGPEIVFLEPRPKAGADCLAELLALLT